MKPTPGSVTGTKIIVLRGGPPQWDGQIEGVSKTGSGRAQRWCHVSGMTIIYGATDRTEKVVITHERRNGPVDKEHSAQVYEYLGYIDEVDPPAQDETALF